MKSTHATVGTMIRTGAIAVAWLAHGVTAETRHVPNDYATIQEALDATADGDEVVVADGTWAGAGNTDLDFPTHLVTLRSESGNRDACIVDGGDAAQLGSILNGETAIIRSITFQNGQDTTAGAAAVITGGDITLEDCVLKDCTEGALFANGGTMTVMGCDITGNFSGGRGGGLHATGGATLTCVDTLFIGNIARVNGGGVYIRTIADGSRISRCRFSSNEAVVGSGGGLFVSTDTFDEISHCLFEGNAAGIIGGGLAVVNGSTRLEGVVIRDNSAVYGGGIAIENSPVEMVNCMVVDNSALPSAEGGDPTSGGVDALGTGTIATLLNCTFAGNSSTGFGGALTAAGNADVTLVNCVMWGDTAPTGPEIQIGTPTFDEGTVTVSSSVVAGGEKGVSTCCLGVLNWGAGNIDEDPLLGVDYCPAADSPVIDAGDDAGVPKGIDDDIDHRARFVDGDGNGTTLVDMGACEFQTCPADLDRNGAVNFADLLAVLGAWGSYDPCPPMIAEDLDRDCEVSFSDILVVLVEWGACR